MYDVNMQIMYESDYNKVKFQFAGNAVIGWNISKSLVPMDSYNSLKSNIHKDLVGWVGSFLLVIDYWCEDHSKNEEIIGGHTQNI